jgi:hypothetical protein
MDEELKKLAEGLQEKTIDPVTAMFIFNAVIVQLFELWKMLRQIAGKENIPEWATILADNQRLQDKIDAEA